MASARRAGHWYYTVLFSFSLLPGASALAAIEPPAGGRFAGLVRQDPAVGLGVIAERPADVPGFAADAARWAAFSARFGGSWRVHVDRRSGTPLLVEGPGIEWFPAAASAAASLADLEARARQFVGEHGGLLRIAGAELVLEQAGSGFVDPDHAVLVFGRQVDGVPVEGERLVFHVTRGRLVAFGADRWGRMARVPQPRLDAARAMTALRDYMGVSPGASLDEVVPPRLVLLPVPSAGDSERRFAGPVGRGIDFRLAWRFTWRVPGERQTWIGRIDAESGDVLAFFDDNRYGQVKGGVFPVTNDGAGADGTEQPAWPMPYADVTIDGTTGSANDAGIFSCADGASARTSLAGPYVRIADACGALSESAVCAADIDLGAGPGTDCARPDGASTGDTHSARTGFHHLNRAMEWGRAWLPSNTWLRSQLVDNTNINSTCNAYWNGSVNFYRAGGGCRNTGEINGVVVHEWGHGIDQNDGGGYDNPSEAYADIVAFLYIRNSCIGRGFWTGQQCGGYGNPCLDCTGIRDQDWDKRRNRVPSTPAGFIAQNCPGGSGPCGKETHCEGYLAGEAVWDLAARDLPASGLDPASAWELTEKLFFKSRQGSGGNAYNCALPNADGCSATSWFTKFRTMDDDDGNLANGTPHAAAIFAAFARHGIACGAAGDAANQSQSACPALGAPALTGAAGSGAAELTWTAVPGALQYLVRRSDMPCGAADTLIATVPVPATSTTDLDLANGFPVHYTVQAQAANSACESPVSNCVPVTPQPFAGTIRFDRPAYSCSTPVVVSVLDANVGGPTTTALLDTQTEDVPETLLLTETAPGSATYAATVFTTTAPAAPGDGLISVSPGDTLTARYIDADDGMGATDVPRQTTAVVDCTAPVISALQHTGVTDVQATISWTTDKPTDTVLHYGHQRPPESTFSAPARVTQHSVTLTNLQACTVYYYWVEGEDVAGNRTTSDAGGQFHHFETLGRFSDGLKPCHQGRVSLAAAIVGCGDTLRVTLIDIDLNRSPAVADTAAVTVASATEATPETLLVIETGVATSEFTGSIPTTPAAPQAGDGRVATRDADWITATYRDADDGTGAGAVAFADATVDCRVSGTSGLSVFGITDTQAEVQWSTSEPTTARLEWGPTPLLGNVLTDDYRSTSHSFVLAPLASCGRFYFRAFSTDVYGNTAAQDAAGAPFAFNAYEVPGAVFHDGFETLTGWTLEGEWQIDRPLGLHGCLGYGFEDPWRADHGEKILGHDITGLGAHAGCYENGPTQRAISPVINASTLTHATLYFKGMLNAGAASNDGASIEVRKSGVWNTVWNSGGGWFDSWWSDWEIDISRYADRNAQLQIAFRQKGGSGPYQETGWNVDELYVRDGTQPWFAACGGCAGAPAFEGLSTAVDLDPCADTGVLLSWAAAPAWGTGRGGTYSVYRDTVPNFVPSAANRAATGLTTTTWTDTGAPNGVTFHYLVRAENDETCSTGPRNGGVTDANAVYRSVRDDVTHPVPGDVGASLRVGTANAAHVRLTWSATPQAARYHVNRSPSATGPFGQVGDVVPTLFDDIGQAANGQSWYYLVRASDACGNEGP